MRKILVIHGPNLQLLGEREVSVYGKVTLKQINEALVNEAAVLGVEVEILQSNHEGEIVDRRAPEIFRNFDQSSRLHPHKRCDPRCLGGLRPSGCGGSLKSHL